MVFSAKHTFEEKSPIEVKAINQFSIVHFPSILFFSYPWPGVSLRETWVLILGLPLFGTVSLAEVM